MQISISTQMKERNLSVPKRVRNLLDKYNATLHLPGAAEPVLGPELVTTGSSNLTGWSTTSPGSYSVVDGRIAITDAGGTAGIYRDITVTAGKEYVFSADTESVGGTGDMRVYVGGGFSTQLASTGLFTSRLTRPLKFIAQTNSIRLYIVEQGSTGTTCYAAGVSVREILSYNDTVSSFHTGNFTESTGQTYASIDGKVGLVTDVAWSLGPDVLNGAGSFDSAAGWTLGSGFEISGGRLNGTAATGTSHIYAPLVAALKTYVVEVDVASVTGGSVKVNVGGITEVSSSTAGKLRAIVKADASSIQFVYVQGASFTGAINSISVRELTGILALQATDGYKPVERRGLVNLLLATKDLSIGAIWASTGGSSVTATIAGPFSDTFAKTVNFPSGANIRQNSLTINGNGTVAVYVKRAVSGSATAIRLTTNNGLAWNTGVSKKVVLTDAWQLALVSGVTGSGGTRTDVILGTQDASGGGDVDCIGNVDIYAPALFQGTVTAQQILDAGGIPVTTDAPKSSALGPRYWQFETARATRMLLSKVPFQMSDDFAIVAGVERTADSAGWQTIHSVYGNGVRFQFCFELGKLNCYMTDGDGHTLQITAPTATALNTKAVVSIRKVGSTVVIRQNGIQVGSGTFAATATYTATDSQIGAYNNTDTLDGKLFCLPISKGAITDAELLLLEKFAGKLAGVQI